MLIEILKEKGITSASQFDAITKPTIDITASTTKTKSQFNQAKKSEINPSKPKPPSNQTSFFKKHSSVKQSTVINYISTLSFHSEPQSHVSRVAISFPTLPQLHLQLQPHEATQKRWQSHLSPS